MCVSYNTQSTYYRNSCIPSWYMHNIIAPHTVQLYQATVQNELFTQHDSTWTGKCFWQLCRNLASQSERITLVRAGSWVICTKQYVNLSIWGNSYTFRRWNLVHEYVVNNSRHSICSLPPPTPQHRYSSNSYQQNCEMVSFKQACTQEGVPKPFKELVQALLWD